VGVFGCRRGGYSSVRWVSLCCLMTSLNLESCLGGCLFWADVEGLLCPSVDRGKVRGVLLRAALPSGCYCNARTATCPHWCRAPTLVSAECLPRGVSRLTNLRELLVSRDDSSLPTHSEFAVPEQISELRQLTRLELVR